MELTRERVRYRLMPGIVVAQEVFSDNGFEHANFPVHVGVQLIEQQRRCWDMDKATPIARNRRQRAGEPEERTAFPYEASSDFHADGTSGYGMWYAAAADAAAEGRQAGGTREGTGAAVDSRLDSVFRQFSAQGLGMDAQDLGRLFQMPRPS